MVRPVRIRVSGGWYHVCSRGHNRERIFSQRGDYVHFLELVETMRERFRVRVYAYCLMPNHYHVLVSTPEGNISRAIQWLNGSYGIWYKPEASSEWPPLRGTVQGDLGGRQRVGAGGERLYPYEPHSHGGI